MKKIKGPPQVEKLFTCQKCGHHSIEEVCSGFIQISNFSFIDPQNRSILDYNDVYYETGTEVQTELYQCAGCGEKICSTEEELVNMLLEKWDEKHV